MVVTNLNHLTGHDRGAGPTAVELEGGRYQPW